MLGLVTSLIGGIAPRLIKADTRIDVVVRGEANVAVFSGEAKVKPGVKAATAANESAAAKKRTAAIKKGTPMTTINPIKNGVGKASSLPGE